MKLGNGRKVNNFLSLIEKSYSFQCYWLINNKKFKRNKLYRDYFNTKEENHWNNIFLDGKYFLSVNSFMIMYFHKLIMK